MEDNAPFDVTAAAEAHAEQAITIFANSIHFAANGCSVDTRVHTSPILKRFLFVEQITSPEDYDKVRASLEMMIGSVARKCFEEGFRAGQRNPLAVEETT